MFFKDDIGFWKSFNSIMFKFSEGERYAWILVLSILLAILTMLVRRKPGSVLRWLMPLPCWALRWPCPRLITRIPVRKRRTACILRPFYSDGHMDGNVADNRMVQYGSEPLECVS